MDAHAQPLTRKELIAAAAFLFALGAAAYGWYILHGGLYGDDWGNAAAYRFSRTPRYLTAVGDQFTNLGGRPVLAALLPLPHALFGVHASLHLALGVALAATTSLCCYSVLRLLGLTRIDAAAISGLALLFPWADAIELWPTASLNTVAVIFFFAGLALALLGLRSRGRRSTAMHAFAALLYLLSVLTYEAAGAPAVLAGVLYLGRAPRPKVIRRWVVDIVAVLAGLTYSLVRTIHVRHVGTLHDRLSDIPVTVRQAGALLASSLVPVGARGNLAHRLILAAAVIFFLGLLAQAIRGSDSRWVPRTILAGGCSVAVAAAYFMFLGSGLHPLDPDTGTRTNVFARFPYAALVFALVASAAEIVVRRPSVARPLTLALVAAIAAGYSARLASDESRWAKAGRLQQPVLAAIESRLPRLVEGTTILTFGAPAQVAPNAPIFVATWDLTGALDIQRGDPTLHAYPIYDSVKVRCRAKVVVVHLPGSRGTATAQYGKLIFLDVKTDQAVPISDARSCSREIRRFPAGPYFAP